MNINSVTSMARMAYKLSNLKNYDHSTGQFTIDKFGSTNNNQTSNTANNTQNGINSDYDLMISSKSKRAYLKQQELMKKKQDALKSIETSTTNLQDSAVAMGRNDYSDANGTVKNLRNFIDSYNKNLSTADKNVKIENTAQKLHVDMQQARYSSQFYSAIGINVSQSGALSLNEDKFRTALADNQDKVGSLLGGSNGLVAKTAAVTDKYLGTNTVINTYRPGSSGTVDEVNNSANSGIDSDTSGASAFETAIISSVSSLYDSNTTLLNADLSASDDDSIVDAMKQYAADYTGVVNTLSSYKNDNYSAEYFGLEFAEPRFKSKIYASIGLNVTNNGSMSINEETLRDALVNNRDKVVELLQGDNGLLNKTGSLIGGMFA